MSALILQFPLGGRDCRPAKPPQRQSAAFDFKRFGRWLPLQAHDAVVIYSDSLSADPVQRAKGAELFACVMALRSVKSHPQSELAAAIVHNLKALFEAKAGPEAA